MGRTVYIEARSNRKKREKPLPKIRRKGEDVPARPELEALEEAKKTDNASAKIIEKKNKEIDKLKRLVTNIQDDINIKKAELDTLKPLLKDVQARNRKIQEELNEAKIKLADPPVAVVEKVKLIQVDNITKTKKEAIIEGLADVDGETETITLVLPVDQLRTLIAVKKSASTRKKKTAKSENTKPETKSEK